MHALIVGSRGVGKSTLIRRVLEELGCPIFGFETKMESSGDEDIPGDPVYLYEVGKPRVQGEENLVGRCRNKCFDVQPETFDRFAPRLRRPVPADHVVVLDELGILESSSPDFCGAVLALLDGDAPAIAAVKHKDTPFLEAVRSHPNCKCFRITRENRDELYPKVLEFMKSQLTEKDV